MAVNVASDGDPDAHGVRPNFANPPATARPSGYWWWFNSLMDKEGITRDLEEFKAKGLGGAYLYSLSPNTCGTRFPEGPAFLSPEWKELYRKSL